MSTTPNQKDLLAKKSDLEGILKPDDNDVLHLPDVTITLAESGQFYLAGIDKKLLTLVGNTSGNAVALDGDAGLTFTTSGGSSTITGITSLNGNSSSLAASQSMASAKQDKIIAGTNIQIAQDGKTISATDTTYSTFNGASASVDGSTGLVPKPFIADKDKYLRGDGTWQTIQATPALNDLTDVDLTTPIDGQILKYDAINQEWINANENPGVTELSGLTDVDVTTTTPTNGQGLVYNSTSEKWENANVLASASVSTLTDINLTSLKNGQVLKYDTSTQKWVNAEDIDETNEFGPSAPTASMGKDGQIYMQYVNPTTITYSTVWTGLALSHYSNQPAKVEGFDPSKYYKIRVVGVSYDANVNDEKLVSEIPESSTYSDGWRIGDRMYITTQNNGTELWVYNAPSHPTYPSYITRIDAAQPSEISKVYGKIVNNWIEFPSGSGSSTLTSLSDVNITTPTDGQGLVYNNTTQKWENGTVSSASSIDTLTDVNLTNLTNGQILKYNSTSQKWENANESGGGSSSVTITPTLATGTKIADYSIDGVNGELYAPNGGGGGSSITTLFENNGTTSPASITLEDDLTNYDIVLFQLGATNGDAIFTMAYNVADLTVGDTIGAGSATSIFVWYYYTNSTTLTLRTSAGNVYISTIVGIKLGSGSGGSRDSFITYTKTVTTTNYGWWTVEDENGNTLDPDTYVIIDISVNVRYYDVLWYQDSAGDYRATLFDINDGNEIRSSTTYDWTITYAKKDFSGGGGGSSVIPNPTGTPTDTLNTVSIDGTIYEIQGSGRGSTNGFVKLAEYSGSGQGYAAGDTITLSDDMTNYDMLVFATNMFASPNVYGVPAAFVTVDDFKTRYTERFFTWYEDTTGYNDVNYVSDTSIYVLRVSGVSFHAVYGVKFGGGSSSGILKGLDYANAVALTLPDHTGYDYTPTGYGVLMATSYGDAGTITITCQNEDVKYLTFRNDTWTTSWVPVTKDETYHVNRGSSSTGFPSASWFKFIPWLCEGGSSGSSVTPNPTDPATDTLTSIEIDGTVYNVGGGGSGYTEEVIYSATPTTAAPSTLTLTKPYTDFDMLLFNLYRSADGVMNKYDRVVLTSKLSLNDRIQLITYNEWASYDITTTTSFTLINENSMYIGSVVGLKFGQGSGSGGSSEINYSTTEHKVGTWIDGSDIYEKTIILRENGIDNYTYLDSIFSQSLPANINWINIESFYAKRRSGGWVDCMNNQQETILVPNPTTQGIYFYSQMSHTDIIVTIRYTKTT